MRTPDPSTPRPPADGTARPPAWRRGAGLAMGMLSATILTLFAALAVDVGRMHLARAELQGAADAAARQGAAGLGDGPYAAYNAAVSIARANTCDGQPVRLSYADGDVEAGEYDAKKRQFKKLDPWDKKVNAVHITTRRTGADAVKTVFAGVLGRGAVDLRAEAIAVRLPPVSSKTTVPATSNPWLAGMPKGTTANPVNPHSTRSDFIPDTVGDPNKAPSPIRVADVPFEPGMALSFDSVAGNARYDKHDKNNLFTGPDGDPKKWTNNRYAYGRDNGGTGGTEFGKSDIRAPYNSVIGVFLSDDVPRDADAPPALDFATDPRSREFTTLSPKLGQVFFIGDGANADGVRQKFVVPPKGTRLFLGVADGYEWANNEGAHTTTIYRPTQVYLVE